VSIARKWVFPIVVFAAIAAALVKIAFFPDSSQASNPDFPSVEIVEPQYSVMRGTVSNDVQLTGTVIADSAVPIPATGSGEVREVLVSQGQQVSAGQQILLIRSQVAYSDGTSGTEWDYATAPVAGTLSSFTALVGQQFSVGEAVGQIAPPGFKVTGSIPPEQLYRLITRPADAQVTITGGPAPFTCTALTITTPLPGAGAGSQGGEGTGGTGGTTGPTVTCTVPSDVVVFAGLAANIVIAGGIAQDVLVVPTTAVEGAAGTGNVYFVLPDGTTETRAVTLGLNDGVNVEVTEGLEEGDLILQFVPGAPSVDGGMMGGDKCFPTGDGGMVCEG
jgi:hypothetical protein